MDLFTYGECGREEEREGEEGIEREGRRMKSSREERMEECRKGERRKREGLTMAVQGLLLD